MDYDEECQLHAEIDRLRAQLARTCDYHACCQTFSWERKRAEKAEARLAAVIALCDGASPSDQCLYGEEGENCMSYCDCRWGMLWHETVRAAATGDTK